MAAFALEIPMTVRTRFAPSPTGFLHLGGARTALFSWAFARKHHGTFVLRIEDTDLERSTPESVQAILDGIHWLGLDYDEGPFYQMQRMARYREVIAELVASGKAYYCYASKEELEAMRAAQEARGEKPMYDRRWRPEEGKTLPTVPEGVTPVVRFRNPRDGVVAWEDAVKGRIEIANKELDDLIIARPDGTPTYNFCVVVDDWDMQITHVIRGDDHVNNTPRQINILQALGAPLPVYAHVPMILAEDGRKMSKRRDAVSVVEYETMGLLPAAFLNYLARLGWGCGDAEVFSREEFVQMFTLEGVNPSPSRFDRKKLLWLNQQYIKNSSVDDLLAPLQAQLAARGVTQTTFDLPAAMALLQERASTLVEMAEQLAAWETPPLPSEADQVKHLTAHVKPALTALLTALNGMTQQWDGVTLANTLKTVAAEQGLKFPQLAMPLRLCLTGSTQTPSVDALLQVLGAELVLTRLQTLLANYPA